MIGVKFNGRLGNQIFQLAFFEYLKTNNRDKSFYFTNPQDSYLTRYFDLSASNSRLLGSWLFSIYPRAINKFFKLPQVYIQNFQVPRELAVRNWTIYKGFFQTDWYVRRIAGEFKISIKKQFADAFESQFGDLFDQNKTIVVHIRRTDYLNYGKRDVSLPMTYFRKRLEALGNTDDYQVIFVSDDIEYAKAYFGEKPNYMYSSNNEITDFQIISHADIAIISNSSFAWWACYLSPKQNLVYAPKNWLGFRIGKEHPKKIMTDRFTWCDVLD